MNGSFENVTIAIRPNSSEEGAPEWILEARYVTYDFEAADVVVLRIVSPGRAVKIECDEDAIADSSTPAFGVDSRRESSYTALPLSDTPPNADERATVAKEELEEAASSRPQHSPVAHKQSKFGAPRKRKRCNVDACVRFSRRRIAQADAYGPSGPRCMRHGGGPLPRNGSMSAASSTEVSSTRRRTTGETSSKAGIAVVPRCASGARFSLKGNTKRSWNRHNAGVRGSRSAMRARCIVDGCARFSRRRVAHADAHGPSGPRCMRHGGGPLRCDVSVPATSSKEVSSAQDRTTGEMSPKGGIAVVTPCDLVARFASEEGTKHNRRRQNTGVRGSRNGKRARCIVENCARFSRRRVAQADAYGPSGPRCMRHGGRPLLPASTMPTASSTEVPSMHDRTTRKTSLKTESAALTHRASVARFPSKGSTKRNCSRQNAGLHASRRATRARCIVDNCARFSRRRVAQEDAYGPSGPRCMRHGGRPLPSHVSARAASSTGVSLIRGRVRGESSSKTEVADVPYDTSGPRLSSKVHTNGTRDKKGAGGGRHPRCNVESCVRFSRRRIAQADEYGPSGPRCTRHGGRPLRLCVSAPAESSIEVSSAHGRTIDESWPKTDASAVPRSDVVPGLPSEVRTKGNREKMHILCGANLIRQRALCNVRLCTRFSRRVVRNVDAHGRGEPRSGRHVYGESDGSNNVLQRCDVVDR